METLIQQTHSYLTFRLNEEIFAAEVSKVLEILEIPKITHVPRSPAFMRGVINLRGSVLPVIDTRAKFGLPPIADTINTCIVVMNHKFYGEQMSIGAIVDAVQEVMEINETAVQPAPTIGSQYKSEFLQGMVKLNEQFIMLLNVDLVFSTEEVSLLQEAAVQNNL